MDSIIDNLLSLIGGSVKMKTIIVITTLVITIGAIIVFRAAPKERHMVEAIAEEVIQHETGVDVKLIFDEVEDISK